MSNNQVSIASCTSYDKENIYLAYKKSLEPLGGIESFVKKDSVVAIKPNLVRPMKPDAGATTHPEAVRAVIRLVREAGGIPKIVESPGGPATGVYVRGVLSSCGILKMAEEEGVECCTDLKVTQVKVPDAHHLKNLHVIDALVDADVIINMPKPKPHGMMVYTGAVKNMFGAIAGTTKFDYHLRQSDYNDFANSIIDIYLAVQPTLSLMDGVVSMHKRGPTSGEAYRSNFVMAAVNGFAMDLTFLKMIGLSWENVLILKNGVERKLCSPDEIDVFLNGTPLEDIKELRLNDYILPTLAKFKMPGFVNKLLRPRPVFKKKCIKCKKCVEICPAKALEMGQQVPKVNLEKCIRCYCCEELCPANAIDIRRF